MIDLVSGQVAQALLNQWEFVVLYIGASAIVSGVVVNFALKRAAMSAPIAEERIVVATLTMSLFFIVMFFIGRAGLGRLVLPEWPSLVVRLVGAVLIVYAAVINIAGRIALGRFWSDQIEIVAHHELVHGWPYNWSRHPLYGSMTLFGIGMGMLTQNLVVLVATIIVFLPAMLYRSAREEALLLDEFGDEYRNYRRRVRMLLPLPRIGHGS